VPELVRIGALSAYAEIPRTVSGPPVLLIHGILATGWYFEKYQRFLAARGYPSYAVNLRGRAESRPVPEIGRVTIHELVADGLEAARAIGRPVVIGHSMGGLIAQRLAEEDAAEATVLLAPAPPRGITITRPRLMLRQLRHLPALLASRPLVPGRGDTSAIVLNRIPIAEREALYKRFIPDSGRAARDLSLGIVAIDASRLRRPILVVSGLDDRFIAPSIARQVAAKYGAPCWQYPGNGHFLPWEPGWDRILADVEGWVRRLATSAEARGDQSSTALLSPGGAT
jgi:pimeloyl-ACP methyl ester carboxylesterase